MEPALSRTFSMCDVFVSFRFTETFPLAEGVKKELEKLGYTTFVCAVPVGDSIAKQIARNLAVCRLVVVLGSETYGQETKSPFSTYNELEYILADHKPFFLVKTCDAFTEHYAKVFLPTTIAHYPLRIDPKNPGFVPEDLVKRIVKKLEGLDSHETRITGKKVVVDCHGVKWDYEGEMVNGMANEFGVAVAADRTRYEGQYKDDKKHGYGKMLFLSAPFEDDRYEGEYQDDKRNGQGKYFYSSGNHYEGEFRDDKRNGQGKYFFANGDRAEGEWRDGRQSGQGKYFYASGNHYEGEFRDDKRNGHGKYFFANGDRYEGEFRDDKRSGHGEFFFVSGNRYEGEWKDGEKNGQGKHFFANGDRYEGEFKNDKFNGYGTQYSAKDGSTIIATNAQGKQMQGQWKDNKFVG
jgi:hypothetical protein